GDPSLAEAISRSIVEGESAGKAVIEAREHFVSLLKNAESEYIRQRIVDIEEICLQILREIYGPHFGSAPIILTEPSVIVAESLAPQQLLSLDRALLKAIVLEQMSATSHAVI